MSLIISKESMEITAEILKSITKRVTVSEDTMDCCHLSLCIFPRTENTATAAAGLINWTGMMTHQTTKKPT
jgi:hypothetical protein